MLNFFLIKIILFSACRYEKGQWSECNPQSQMTRNDKLKPNSDASCEQNRQITKKCKAKGAKPTKGKKGKCIDHPFLVYFYFSFTYFLIICMILTRLETLLSNKALNKNTKMYLTISFLY